MEGTVQQSPGTQGIRAQQPVEGMKALEEKKIYRVNYRVLTP